MIRNWLDNDLTLHKGSAELLVSWGLIAMNLHEASIIPANDVASDHDERVEHTERLTSVFERLQAKLKSWLEREFGGGPPYPEDVVQQTFEKLSSHPDLSQVHNLEAYAWTTAVNCVRKEKRAEMAANAYASECHLDIWGSEVDEFDPERVLGAREELEIVARTLQRMPGRRREIFMACRFEGLSQEAAGARVGVTRNAAVRHIAVATDMIVKALAAKR